jgi:hypothetical protein
MVKLVGYVLEFPLFSDLNPSTIQIDVPVVPHKAVAEVSKIGNL